MLLKSGIRFFSVSKIRCGVSSGLWYEAKVKEQGDEAEK